MNNYSIKEIKNILNVSKSQIYKLLQNKDGVIVKGQKQYNERILFTLLEKKLHRKL